MGDGTIHHWNGSLVVAREVVASDERHELLVVSLWINREIEGNGAGGAQAESAGL
jgi:hypothetical protein